MTSHQPPSPDQAAHGPAPQQDEAAPPALFEGADGQLHFQSLNQGSRRSFLYRTVKTIHDVTHNGVMGGFQHQMHGQHTHVAVALLSATKIVDPFCAASVALSALKMAGHEKGHGHGQGHAHAHAHDHAHGHGADRPQRRTQLHQQAGGAGADPSDTDPTDTGPGRPLPARTARDASATDALVTDFVLKGGLAGRFLAVPNPSAAGASASPPAATPPTPGAPGHSAPAPSAPATGAAAPAADPAPGPVSAAEAGGAVRLQKLHGDGPGITGRVLKIVRAVADSAPIQAGARLAQRAINNPWVMGGAAALYGYLTLKTGGSIDLSTLPSWETGFDMLKTGVYSVIAFSAAATATEIVSRRTLEAWDRRYSDRRSAPGPWAEGAASGAAPAAGAHSAGPPPTDARPRATTGGRDGAAAQAPGRAEPGTEARPPARPGPGGPGRGP